MNEVQYDIIKPCQNIVIQHNDAEINFYQKSINPKHTLVMCSGFGFTVEKLPLLRTILDWGLNHKCRIVVVKTFLNDLELCTPDRIKNYTYDKFQKLYNTSMDIIPSVVQDKEIHIIAHSTPSIPITMYLNSRVKDKKDIPVSSVTLFAPYPINNGILASFKRGISLDKTMSEQEKSQKMQTIDNMLPLTQQLFDAVKNIDYKVMGQYKFPWYLVAGSRDEIAPAQNINNIVNTVNKPNVIGITVPGNHNLSSVKTVQKQLIINTLHFLLNTKKTM